MAYNSYNTRGAGRYNTQGKFVYGGESQQHRMPQQYRQHYRQRNQQQYQEPQQNQQQEQQEQQQQERTTLPPPPPPVTNTPVSNTPATNTPVTNTPATPPQSITNTEDVEMKADEESDNASLNDSTQYKPYWMKSKLAGVKKISNKERRRRQNENLRRLITPKNALMVLNEMMPGDHLVAQFKVEPASTSKYYQTNSQNFCADLTVDGTSYKGYGENKIMARNAAAEQAIRDLIIKRMTKVISSEKAAQAGEEESGEGGAGEAGEGEGEEGGGAEALPMIQLASFALHKLFAEWEYEGHRVPQLKPGAAAAAAANSGVDSASEASASASAGAGAGAGAAAGPKAKPRALPQNAAAMHPCMLLTYMRPHLEYRELAVEGDRPQNMVFTMGVDVDGATYIGKAANKREARKLAARSACCELFGVQFDPAPSALAPQPAA